MHVRQPISADASGASVPASGLCSLAGTMIARLSGGWRAGAGAGGGGGGGQGMRQRLGRASMSGSVRAQLACGFHDLGIEVHRPSYA